MTVNILTILLLVALSQPTNSQSVVDAFNNAQREKKYEITEEQYVIYGPIKNLHVSAFDIGGLTSMFCEYEYDGNRPFLCIGYPSPMFNALVVTEFSATVVGEDFPFRLRGLAVQWNHDSGKYDTLGVLLSFNSSLALFRLLSQQKVSMNKSISGYWKLFEVLDNVAELSPDLMQQLEQQRKVK